MAKVMVVDDAYSELLIDRGGQLLAMDGGSQALDAVSISALAAAAFSSTAAMAQLILLAVFDERTTDGMVRVFGKEASRAVGAVLGEARPRLAGEPPY